MKPNRFVLITAAELLIAAHLSAFTYSDFSSTAGLNLTGSAFQTNSVIRITPAQNNQLGAAWLSSKQYLGDGFNTTFSFRITNPGGSFGGGDGLAFAIQNQSPTVLGSEYGASNGAFFGISFNTYNNLIGEPSDNFVGVVTNVAPDGTASWTTQVDLDPTPIRLKDGNVHTANIYYYDHKLSVALDGISVINNYAISLNSGVDPGNFGWVGFGARTGNAYENADILSWTMVPEPAISSLAVLGGAIAAHVRARRNRRSLQQNGNLLAG